MGKDKIEEVILFQIEKTNKISKIYSQKEFERVGLPLTVDQWILLKIIQESQPISQKELAQKSMRDPASITRTLDLLQKKEWIVREIITGNRRQYDLKLTVKGKGLIKKHMEMVQNHRKLSIEGFTNDELLQLNEMLKRIQKNMQ